MKKVYGHGRFAVPPVLRGHLQVFSRDVRPGRAGAAPAVTAARGGVRKEALSVTAAVRTGRVGVRGAGRRCVTGSERGEEV